MVETSLSLLVFICTIVGVFDMAQFLFVHATLAHRVAAAARYGSVHAYNAAAIQNIVLYDTAAPAAGAQTVFGLTREMVQVARVNPSTTEDRVTVTVSGYSFSMITPLIAGRFRGQPISSSVPYEYWTP